MGKELRIAFEGAETVEEGPNRKGQQLFLEAIERVVPEALTELIAIALMPATPAAPRAYMAWAQRRGFWRDVWLRHEGLVLIRARRRRMLGLVKAEEFKVIGEAVSEIAPPIAFAWTQGRESKAAFLARVQAAVDQVAPGPGQQLAPTKAGIHHFEMLALEHVGGFGAADIAARYGRMNPRNVRQANDETAKMIGLTLRPRVRTGRRPSKSRKTKRAR